MIFELAGLKLNVEFFHTVENDKPPLLFLHGFTGSSEDWKPIVPHIDKNFSTIGIDIIGHGKSDSPQSEELYTAESISNQISSVIELTVKGKVIPVGYSMGGRAALNFSFRYPEKIAGLILESTTPGIKNEKLRDERIKSDDEIIEFIKTHTVKEFVAYWVNKEIFDTQRRFSEEKRKYIKESKLRNNPDGLANSLQGFGTGKMPPLFEHLKDIKCKTLLITGELDSKFTNINSEIVGLFPKAEHKIIKNAGHNTHLEEPEKFIGEVNQFLNS
ncbi:MAG: 2-succinyl-6-hydroxy-2,4-cyclohexadiene-1-carboxylate synthase [Ignavibacteria bacterium GWA2_35_9]|nr:MAG: 2-succinyl-6-hydroxy-2,4-cyclohexadiene-1-carboxylate synthase [Ignavibacteria bacterium GWA2_35_9]OGU44975.1 MAG: 2-succinyl-6-hydroxy-2,4-cyclohexadiene-1-carboxylate synthase [Ignavibacteria bacterium GWB2_36_8]HLG32506.1 2-succinyl-6-hydroxy-2,4-cyclohexadiene-1-carboxylate synthase [Ignavibacteriaceae bacterium]